MGRNKTMNTVTNITDVKETLRHDGQLQISTGKSRFEKKWKNKLMQWSVLVKKLESPVKTPETQAEYKKMAKADQDKIKDVGGYVGGSLKGGKRGTSTVACRSLITLDLDFAPYDYFQDLELIGEYAALTYTTHKHSKDNPRYRLLVPLDRNVSPEEYEAIARKIAEDIGIDYFDDTTYQPSRLMYWPSVSADGEYICKFIDAPFLSADETLARYPDWKDSSYWPESSRAAGIKKRLADKQGDPTEKKGIIGAFCRTYSVTEAIEKFIPEAYTATDKEDRYTYTGGSTAAGLVIYGDGKWAYSNHGTDPISGLLCNAFDIVRIHKFGEEDEAFSGSETTKLPSYRKMIEFCMEDPETKKQMGREILGRAKEDFADDLEALQYDAKGNLVNTVSNIVVFMKQQADLDGIFKNEMSGFIEVDTPLPWTSHLGQWRDADDVQLIAYLDKFGKFSKQKVQDALIKLADDRRRHPVKDYLDSLPEWDGVERVDSLLIDYLGADDSEYTRQVTRKTLCAAVYRIYKPGCKHDTILVLNGPQGIGKSTLIARLGMNWFSDNLSLTDTKDKTAAEKLQGYWILEIGELAGMRKTEIETLRGFISRQDDIYRASYGRNIESHKRQCIFIGTTNAEEGYLRDLQGNRRFWDVKTPGSEILKAWELDQFDIDQIWAEVKMYCEAGESTILKGEVLKIAEELQRAALESDPREGQIREYLETLIPDEFYSWNLERRRDYFSGSGFDDVKGTKPRAAISLVEIWVECLGLNRANMKPKDSYELAGIMTKIEGWEKTNKLVRLSEYGPQRVYKRL